MGKDSSKNISKLVILLKIFKKVKVKIFFSVLKGLAFQLKLRKSIFKINFAWKSILKIDYIDRF
jgi:hypothetical protein